MNQLPRRGYEEECHTKCGNNGCKKKVSEKPRVLIDPARYVYLPSEDFVLQNWKASAGTPVRTGEKLAVAIRKGVDDGKNRKDNDITGISGEFQLNEASSSTTTAAHKRPKKRRRPGPSIQTTVGMDNHSEQLDAATVPISDQQRNFHHVERDFSSNYDVMNRLHPQNSVVTLVAPADGLLRIIDNDITTSTSSEQSLTIGFIEECLHPQILSGMCAVCGVVGSVASSNTVGLSVLSNHHSDDDHNIMSSKALTYEDSTTTSMATSASSNTMSQVTVSGGITMMVSEEEGQQIAMDSAQRLIRQQKLALVLDLDHTLVHATYDPRAHAHLIRDDVRSVVLPVFEANFPTTTRSSVLQHHQQQKWMLHYIKLRPYVKEFLECLQPLYEIGVYTAGTRLYADQITKLLTRIMVGATMDQLELDELRNRIARLTTLLSQNSVNQKKHADKKHIIHTSSEEELKPYVTSTVDNMKQEESESETIVLSQLKSVDLPKDESSFGHNLSNASRQVENNEVDVPLHQLPPTRTRKHVTFDPAENIGHPQPPMEHEDDDGHNSNHGRVDGYVHGMGVAAAGELDMAAEDVSHRKRVRFGDASETSAATASVSYSSSSNNQHVDGDDSDDVVAHAAADDAAAGNNSKPRKRVSFGEPPESSGIVDMETELETLRQQLDEAECLENAATKLRQQLFGNRIVSRTDVADLGKDVKSLRRIFPCGGTMAVVVDDREDVWANALDNASGRKGEPPENLLLVRPYHWKPFLGFADVNNAAGVDLSSSTSSSSSEDSGENNGENLSIRNTKNTDESDVQLEWTRDILVRLHHAFYSTVNHSKSVATILNEMRSQVLEKTNIVLSGLVSLNKQNRTPSLIAPRPPIVRIAESLGAMVSDRVEPTVTHVVAAKDGTEKVLRAQKLGSCHVVQPSWLMECLWTLTHRDERDHYFSSSRAYKAIVKTSDPPTVTTMSSPSPSLPLVNKTNHTKEAAIILPLDPRMENSTSGSSDNDDEDDDEFAASFENELMDS